MSLFLFITQKMTKLFEIVSQTLCISLGKSEMLCYSLILSKIHGMWQSVHWSTVVMEELFRWPRVFKRKDSSQLSRTLDLIFFLNQCIHMSCRSQSSCILCKAWDERLGKNWQWRRSCWPGQEGSSWLCQGKYYCPRGSSVWISFIWYSK